MKDMKDLVQRFRQQLEEALQIGEMAAIRSSSGPVRNCVITGLGGSGIGGTIVAEVVSGECAIPIVVNKDYFLPSFVDADSLVIVCSYSGNTEETLHAMEEALRRKAKVVCVTSGGRVAELASRHDCDLILIPGGLPPRACLGYSLVQLFFVLFRLRMIGDGFLAGLRETTALLTAEENGIREDARKLADFLYGKIPVIYAVDGNNGVATRFRQQVNENSKMLCWHHVLPEMNHNELVGWAEPHPECAVVILRNKSDYSRTQARIEISKDVFSKYAGGVMEIWSKGDSRLAQCLYLIHLTDWTSCFLADKKGIDAVEVNIINHLKGSLAKL